MYTSEPTRPPLTAIAARSCRSCSWEIDAGSALVADLEEATHRVAAHASLPERVRIQRLVVQYRSLLGDLPARLLVLAVRHVMDSPTDSSTQAPLALLLADGSGEGVPAWAA